MVCQFGGQTAINLAAPLDAAGIRILGITRDAIDETEDRERFDALLERLGIPRPPGAAVTDYDKAVDVAHRIRFPVLVRPSYVLGGRAMQIIYTTDDLRAYIRDNDHAFDGQPLLIDKFFRGKEAEVDVVSDGDERDHPRRDGAHRARRDPQRRQHGGLPAADAEPAVHRRASWTMPRASRGRSTRRGLINIQFVVDKDDDVYVIEVNPRASRTVPFISKITGVPMIKLAMRAMMGGSLAGQGFPLGLQPVGAHGGGQEPGLQLPEAARPGRAAGAGDEVHRRGDGHRRATTPRALHKALTAAGIRVPTRQQCHGDGAVGDDRRRRQGRRRAADRAASPRWGLTIYSTTGTAAVPERAAGIAAQRGAQALRGPAAHRRPIWDGKFQLVINTVSDNQKAEAEARLIRREAVEHNIPVLTSLDTAGALLTAIQKTSDERAGEHHRAGRHRGVGAAGAPGRGSSPARPTGDLRGQPFLNGIICLWGAPFSSTCCCPHWWTYWSPSGLRSAWFYSDREPGGSTTN